MGSGFNPKDVPSATNIASKVLGEIIGLVAPTTPREVGEDIAITAATGPLGVAAKRAGKVKKTVKKVKGLFEPKRPSNVPVFSGEIGDEAPLKVFTRLGEIGKRENELIDATLDEWFDNVRALDRMEKAGTLSAETVADQRKKLSKMRDKLDEARDVAFEKESLAKAELYKLRNPAPRPRTSKAEKREALEGMFETGGLHNLQANAEILFRSLSG
jgi:hypothetical protein